MIVLILTPIASGLVLYSFTKPQPEPLLPALVMLDTMWIEPKDNKDARRLVPCIVIKNPTEQDWNNLSVGVNEQFYSQEPKGLISGATVSLPLEIFVSRNGSVRFPVGNREVKRATVFAQMATGARGVSEHNLIAAKGPKKNATRSWIPGVRKADYR